MIGEVLGSILGWIVELFFDLVVWLLPESWQNRIVAVLLAAAGGVAAWHFWPFG